MKVCSTFNLTTGKREKVAVPWPLFHIFGIPDLRLRQWDLLYSLPSLQHLFSDASITKGLRYINLSQGSELPYAPPRLRQDAETQKCQAGARSSVPCPQEKPPSLSEGTLPLIPSSRACPLLRILAQHGPSVPCELCSEL